MENHETIAEFELPEFIIQHIQSFMNESEAAQTTLLSKSWYGAWSTRPNLVFEPDALPCRINEFPEFSKKTMQRYEDLNRKIKSFTLWMDVNHSLATQLISKAIKLGATDLMIANPNSLEGTPFVLPEEVLESKAVAGLFLCGLALDLQRRRKKEVSRSNLKSLTLFSATVNGDLIRDLISRCPLIENLALHKPMSLFGDERRRIPFYDSEIILHKLKYLFLGCLDIEDSLSWHKFPCLKQLVISDEDVELMDVRICSPSLERISILSRSLNAEFDVPNIRKFVFKGFHVPRLVMKTTSREWESDIHIDCYRTQHNASWFSALNKLVKMLSPSRVFLYLDVAIQDFNDHHPVYVEDGLRVPAVENLTLKGYAGTPAFLDALFWSCRPNFANIERQCVYGMEKVDVEQFQQLQSLPWKTLLDASKDPQEFVRFQLK